MGFVVMYAGCPIMWGSKLQTQYMLSTTESKYLALSTALCQVIPMMAIVRESQNLGFEIPDAPLMVNCHVFEDNSSAIEMAKTHKFWPRTKHINCKYHHFHLFVNCGDITIHGIGTDEHPGDLYTKALPEDPFVHHQKFTNGW
jgi:hypothetical protein